MSKEIQTISTQWNPALIQEEMQSMKKLCSALMETQHYKKMGNEGIFAIVQKAKALNVNPIDALNGGLYCVNGKVEMSSNMMIQLIRQAGHSVTKDKRSDDTICILHGKRKDNGDTWTESFSIADAKRAGIYKNTWEKFPRNMLFARALSNLARQLFPDAIKGCFVEGEISESPLKFDHEKEDVNEKQWEIPSTISMDEAIELQKKLEIFPEIRASFMSFLKNNYEVEEIKNTPIELYAKIMARLEKAEKEELKHVEEDVLQLEVEEA